MTNKEKELWLSVKYPITIICDRYDGTYSGASWLAFPLDYDNIPEDVDGEDILCAQFWKNYKEPVGKGGCAEEAIDNLLLEMEPTESRDERIRKKIKSYLEAIKDGAMMCFNTSEEIAWLEKQKEPKPVEWSEEDSIAWHEALTCVRKAMKVAKDKEEIQGADTAEKWLKAIKFKYCAHPVKQEWSEEDKKVIEAACALLSEYAGYYREKDMEVKDLQLYRVSERLKSLRPQPKQEWSEEDKKMLELIISDLREFRDCETDEKIISEYEDEIAFLKSLRPQPRSEVEWLQVDNNYISDAIACVTRCYEMYADNKVFYDSLHYNIMDIKRWLLKLGNRLRWKPSKEQLSWLLVAIGDEKERGSDVAKRLKSLYEDLRKL